jgi:hypothetical protein
MIMGKRTDDLLLAVQEVLDTYYNQYDMCKEIAKARGNKLVDELIDDIMVAVDVALSDEDSEDFDVDFDEAE